MNGVELTLYMQVAAAKGVYLTLGGGH